jgi:hypothetical protein
MPSLKSGRERVRRKPAERQVGRCGGRRCVDDLFVFGCFGNQEAGSWGDSSVANQQLTGSSSRPERSETIDQGPVAAQASRQEEKFSSMTPGSVIIADVGSWDGMAM